MAQTPPIRVAVDCMGGDHAPQEIVAGALAAARDAALRILLVGVPEAVRPLLPPGVTAPSDGADRRARSSWCRATTPCPRARRRS